MKTDDLINSLSHDLAPVSTRSLGLRMTAGLGAGAVASALVMLQWLHLRDDLMLALATPMFWVKFAYTGLSFIALYLALSRLARPGLAVGRLLFWIGLPLAILTTMAVVRMAGADAAERMPLVMGSSSQVCPWRITMLSLPILAGAIWAMRGMAPTRLGLAGLAAGACAGALGAWIYAFHCGESAAPLPPTPSISG